MKGLPQDPFRPHVIHTTRGKYAHVEENDVLKNALHARDIVMHYECGLAAPYKPAQVFDEPTFSLVVNTGEGFVEKKHVWRLRKSPCEERPLTLTAREIGKGSVGKMRKAHKSEERLDLCSAFSAPRESGEDIPSAGKTHGHDFGDGDREVEIDVRSLGHICHPRLAWLKGGAEDLGRSVLGFLEAKQGSQKSGLARAVWPHKGANGAFGNFEGDMFESGDAAGQVHAECLKAQGGGHLEAVIPERAETMVFVFRRIILS
jgi:hypothetical protein